MTISTETYRDQYLGNNTTATYDYNFKINNATQLSVITSVDGVDTTLSYPSEYSVAGAGNDEGGSITLLAGNLATGVTLTVALNVPFLQQTDLKNQSNYYPDQVEAALDYCVMLAKTLRNMFQNLLTFPVSYSGSKVLPAASANKIIGWNSAATALENKTVADLSATSVSSFMSTLLASSDATAALASLGVPDGAIVTFSSNRNVTSADNCKILVYNNTGAQSPSETLTLPLASAVPDGFKFKFINDADSRVPRSDADDFRILMSGADSWVHAGSSSTVYVRPGVMMVIQKENSTTWRVVEHSVGPLSAAADKIGAHNIGLEASINSGALRINVRQLARKYTTNFGDPEGSMVVTIRDTASSSSAGAKLYERASSTLFELASGETLGAVDGLVRVWVVAVPSSSNAQKFTLGVIQAVGSLGTRGSEDILWPVKDDLVTTSALGAAVAAGTCYSDTAAGTYGCVVLGYIDATRAAGAWSAVNGITIHRPGMPLPGDVIASTTNGETTGMITGTTVVPLDDTIPQVSEGFQAFTWAAPTGASNYNLFEYNAELNVSPSVLTTVVASIYRGADTDALRCAARSIPAGVLGQVAINHTERVDWNAADSGSIRIGGVAAGTVTLNGAGGASLFGGKLRSQMVVKEIMA